MRFKIVLPFSIRDSDRIINTFIKHLEKCMMEPEDEQDEEAEDEREEEAETDVKVTPKMVFMVVVRETLPESKRNETDTIFVETLDDTARSEELTFLSIAMVRTWKELCVHGFELRVEPALGIAA